MFALSSWAFAKSLRVHLVYSCVLRVIFAWPSGRRFSSNHDDHTKITRWHPNANRRPRDIVLPSQYHRMTLVWHYSNKMETCSVIANEKWTGEWKHAKCDSSSFVLIQHGRRWWRRMKESSGTVSFALGFAEWGSSPSEIRWSTDILHTILFASATHMTVIIYYHKVSDTEIVLNIIYYIVYIRVCI